MGNRAVITTQESWKYGGLGIYLHWNGGRDSVEAFLEYCRLRGFRTGDYGLARLTQVIANFFGGGLCVGIGTLWKMDCDNGDNGVYIIDGWEIVDRAFFNGVEQHEYNMQEMLQAIDERQPESERLGSDFFDAKLLPVKEIKLGDVVWVQEFDGPFEKQTVVGIGTNMQVNGTNVLGLPYIGKYGENPAWNINNYLRDAEYRVDRF